MERKREFGTDRRRLERGGAAPSSASVRAKPWLSADTKTRIKERLINVTELECLELSVSLVGYAVILASGYFFKLAIAAALAPFFSFLSAAALGGLVCQIPFHLVLMIIDKLTTFDVDDCVNWLMIVYPALSPVAGALLLNFALGWNLALVPMMVVPLVGMPLIMTLCLANEKYKDYKRNSQRSETVAHVSMNQAIALNTHGQFARRSQTNASSAHIDHSLLRGGFGYNR